MKKTLAAAAVAAIAGVAGAANAADMSGGGLKDAPAFVPPPTWTGFYIGGHVGGFWSDINWGDNGYYNYYYRDYDWGYRHTWNNNESGVFGGGQLGYNWQTGAFVLGVEVDLGAVGLSHNHNLDPYGYYWGKDEATFYADFTGRLGYAAGPVLLYAKGGGAFLDTKDSIGGGLYYWNGDGFTNYNWSSHNTGRGGWVVGGGIEYAFSPNWSVKAEYLFFDFGTNNMSYYDQYADCGKGLTYRFDNEVQVNTFKVGVNYHLAPAYAPLK